MSVRMSSSKVRMVPVSSTSSGMMLWRTPPWMVPKVRTTGWWLMSICRLTMACAWVTIWAAAITGSTPPQGREPWVWRPITRMSKVSEAAMVGPARTAS